MALGMDHSPVAVDSPVIRTGIGDDRDLSIAAASFADESRRRKMRKNHDGIAET
jgi:hypothetical protein